MKDHAGAGTTTTAPASASTSTTSTPTTVAPTTTEPTTTSTAPAPTTSAPTTTLAAPALGLTGAWFEGTGFGQSRPATIDLGGDPTGVVTGITWSSWGGSEAVGTGTAEYVGPNQITADGTEESATVVAYDLGTCDSHYVYEYVRWYFPQHGETLSSNPESAIDACTGPAS